MQAAKNAAATAKESAANAAATAKASADKTKATAQEKVEVTRAHDPTEKAMATERKAQKLHQAECNKQEAVKNNAAARQAAATAGGTQGTHPGGGGIHEGAGLHTNQTGGGHNPDYLTEQHAHNVDTVGAANPGTGLNHGGPDAANPNNPDRIGLGLNPARHATAGGGPTVKGGVDAVYPNEAELGNTNRNTTGGGVGAPGTGYETGNKHQ